MKRLNLKRLKQPQSPARRRFLKIGVGAALSGLGAGGYAAEVEPSHPVVTRHDVRIAGWPSSAAGLKIGQLSDLHCQNDQSVARTAHAAKMLLDLKPDIVFITGDYISTGQAMNWAVKSAAALAPLRVVPRGVFAILGNHDYADGRSGDLADALRQAGFTVLRNQSAPLPGADGIWIVGIESRAVYEADVGKALTGVPESAVKLLLVHEPDFADEAPPVFSFQLSGHSHAGQVRVPGLPPLHCPSFGQKYPEGLQQAQHHQVYTTRGVGMMGPQVRFCCLPEVTLLTVYPA